MKKKTEKKKSNLEELYEEMLKENDENDVQMKRLKAQIEEAKLPKKKKRGRKPTKKQYFTYITDQAINAYNQEEDYMKRNKVYREHIHYAFNKLAENIIHTFKFYYFDVPYEDVKCEVVAFLNENTSV